MGQLRSPAPRAGKWKAVVTEIARMHKAGRPVLVGTTSVERSEGLAALLGGAGARGPAPGAAACDRVTQQLSPALAARPPPPRSAVVRGAGQPGRSIPLGLCVLLEAHEAHDQDIAIGYIALCPCLLLCSVGCPALDTLGGCAAAPRARASRPHRISRRASVRACVWPRC